MRKSSLKPLRSLKLASAGLASALTLVVLGASTPRLAASQSDDFNGQSDANWTHYTFPATNTYGVAIYSFPTNPAGPAGNFAYRIQIPPIVKDTNIPPALVPRGGAVWSNSTAIYGVQDDNLGRFSTGVDLIAWRTDWTDEVVGVGWYVPSAIFETTSAYLAGWGPQVATMGIVNIDLAKNPPYNILGQVVEGSTALKTNHQYRVVASSYNGYTFLVQVFDRSQTNTPWQSAIAEDFSLYGTSGYCALLAANTGVPPPVGGNSTQGADVTFDNYYAYLPVPAPDGQPATMPATVTDTYPPPAGEVAMFYPTVSIGIMNRDTFVKPATILLYLDGSLITSGVTIDATGVHKPNPGDSQKDFPGATVTYPITNLLARGLHTNTIAFQDDQSLGAGTGVWHTNSWSWTLSYPILYATNALPIGSLSVRGFDVRMVQTNGPALENSLARAEQQLAIPPLIPFNRSGTSIVQVLNWNEVSTPPGNVPGLCPMDTNNIAVESFAYLELTAGIHRFYINSDDRAGIYSGSSLRDPNATAVWVNPGDTANTTFDFAVQADGLYPIRCIWEETGGGAALTLKSVNLSDNSQVLINDAGDPTGVVKAWYPIVCRSSSSLSGPYSAASTAVNVLNKSDIVGSDCSPTVVGQMVTGGTFTVPMSGSKQFYRVDGPRKTQITGFQKSGLNVIISYQVQ